jgi:cell division protease FtsH
MKINFIYIFLIQLSSTIFGYQNKFKFQPFDYNKNDYNHLDKKNIEQLEKIFYLKNSRYSPHKNLIYLKYNYNKNLTDLNVIDILTKLNKDFFENIENNTNKKINEINNNSNESYNDNNEYDLDSDFFKSNIPYKKLMEKRTNGYIDPLGVFRFNHQNIPKQSRNQRSESNNNDEFSTDSNFEIIKNSEYTFKDIGGYSKIKSELMQTADILLNPEKYSKYNVRTPKGIIFEGPPGNGKTLMAKGFSGELNVSFIPVSGSEFSEKFVGVGASRVRELFKLAKSNSPCIIFIDEIDAVARKRGNDMVSSNSEKDQTLNQLLINLDGFKGSEGVFLIGATNRVDLLDPALIRPGRMDKNIYIGNPDSETRKEIIKIHLEGKPYDKRIKIEDIVEMSGGFSGAQIENLLNEAMLYALRENREEIMMDDLEYITNRILSGWTATENKFSDDMIERIVIHEMGHAIVGFLSQNHSSLVKVCLNLWSPKTPGYTLFESNDQDINIYTKEGLLSHLMVLLGGRVAEEIFYGYSVTTGAKKDLEEAYRLAQNMILHYGMGKQSIYPDLSEHSKYQIDQEINKLIIEAHERATVVVKNTKDIIIDCGEILKKNNILKPENIIEVINKKNIDICNIYEDGNRR